MMARSKRSVNDGEIEVQIPEDVVLTDSEVTQPEVELQEQPTEVVLNTQEPMAQVLVVEEKVTPNVGVIAGVTVVNRFEPVCVSGVTLLHGENTVVDLARISDTPRFKALVKQGHIFVKN